MSYGVLLHEATIASKPDIRKKWHVNGGGWGGHGSSFMEEMFAEEKKRK